jgi:hypothetical protein
MVKQGAEKAKKIFVNTSFTKNQNNRSYLKKIFSKYIITFYLFNYFPFWRRIIKQTVYIKYHSLNWEKNLLFC